MSCCTILSAALCTTNKRPPFCNNYDYQSSLLLAEEDLEPVPEGNMASAGKGIFRNVRGFFQKPAVKKVVDTFFPDPMDKFKFEDVLWDFKNKAALEEWTLITDDQFGGKSTAEFVQSPGGRAIFKGNISTELPPATDVKYTGMCSIRAQPKWV